MSATIDSTIDMSDTSSQFQTTASNDQATTTTTTTTKSSESIDIDANNTDDNNDGIPFWIWIIVAGGVCLCCVLLLLAIVLFVRKREPNENDNDDHPETYLDNDNDTAHGSTNICKITLIHCIVLHCHPMQNYCCLIDASVSPVSTQPIVYESAMAQHDTVPEQIYGSAPDIDDKVVYDSVMGAATQPVVYDQAMVDNV
jgi:hypothetical protein